LDWDGLFKLKQRWLISVGAIVVRAFTLGLISALQYQRAYKYIHFKGWHKKEPDEFEPESPELIKIAFTKLPTIGVSYNDFARSLNWKRSTLATVSGIEPDKAEVVQITSAKSRRPTA
jgi:Zn-dependent peptidase ImmA (M78 family)